MSLSRRNWWINWLYLCSYSILILCYVLFFQLRLFTIFDVRFSNYSLLLCSNQTRHYIFLSISSLHISHHVCCRILLSFYFFIYSFFFLLTCSLHIRKGHYRGWWCDREAWGRGFRFYILFLPTMRQYVDREEKGKGNWIKLQPKPHIVSTTPL